MRAWYKSLVAVYRLKMKVINGSPTLTWNQLTTVIDPFVEIPGQMMCRLDLGFVKRGDLPMPVGAGRAPDRNGTVFFDAILQPGSAQPFVLAGDRLLCLSGPIQGTFEIRTIPTAAIGISGAHHIEVQVFEVAQSIAQGSPTPFPGSEGPES